MRRVVKRTCNRIHASLDPGPNLRFWLVLNDLSVVGFVDSYGVEGDADAVAPAELFDTRRRSFGGTFSPTVPIGIDDDHVWLVDG